MAEPRRVIIRNDTGLEWSIPEAAFDKMEIENSKTYKDLKYKIISYEDGSAYEAPKASRSAGQEG